MLVLGRKEGERLLLRTRRGDVVAVMLVHLGHDKARIGVECDPETIIWREEVCEDEDLKLRIAALKRGCRRRPVASG